MPLFLNANQIYRILQRESPPSVYPDGAPSLYYSTADQFAFASVLADAYTNLSDIYENYSPLTAVDRLADFETLYFGYTLDSSLTVDERRTILLAKIRTQRRTTPADILAVIYSIISSDIPIEILEWNGNNNGTRNGAWILGVSTLGVDAFLSSRAPIYGNQIDKVPLDCSLDYEAAGITEQDLTNIQDTAYTYTVNIGTTLDAFTLAQIDEALNQAEGASRRHILIAPQGYILDDSGGYLLDDSSGRIING
jgi:hypothetical protein